MPGSRNAPIAADRSGRSWVPASSRTECMDSSGGPTSTVVMPSRVAVSGPIVEPHGRLLLDTNSWVRTPTSRQAPRQTAAPTASVAYRWLALILSSGPPLSSGRFTGSCRPT